MSEYGIKLYDIRVIPGIYVFSGTKMSESKAIEFIENYIAVLGYEESEDTV